jgi:hypothetical protein
MAMMKDGVWGTRGFEAFRRGTFGNAGQNLYVSRAGVLQRIHHLDLNRDGYVDLLFCNAQVHLEAPPACVYRDVFGACKRTELPAGGSPTAAVADISGDGYADLIIGNEKSGNAGRLNANVYFGSPAGLSERYQTVLPAHRCTSVAAGDFDGDGRADLALLTEGRVRLFHQTDLGIEAKEYVDTPIEGVQLGAADLDGDGHAELIVTAADRPPRIYWGAAGGIDPERWSDVPAPDGWAPPDLAETEELSETERVGAVAPLAIAVHLGSEPLVFVAGGATQFLVPVTRERGFGRPLRFACRNALSVAAGDFDGDGRVDLAFACRDFEDGRECSWLYWGGADGFGESARLTVPTHRACDVALADLRGSGVCDLVICQQRTAQSFTVDSPAFAGGSRRLADPVALQTHGARRVHAARFSDDPLPQVVFANQSGRRADMAVDSYLYYGGRDGFSPERRAALRSPGAAAALACDVDDDGWADIILINSYENAIHLDAGSCIYLGGPGGFAAEPDVVIPTRLGWACAIADLNRDGYLDLIVSHFHIPTITIYRGVRGGFDFEDPTVLTVLEGPGDYIPPRRLVLADFDRSGWLDLAVAPAGRNRCVILRGGPDGFSTERSLVLPTSFSAGHPVAHDLTGNGYPDLLLGGGKPNPGQPHDSFNHIFWNGPDGLRADRQTQLPSNCGHGLAIADFNGDGVPDLLSCGYQSAVDRDVDAFIYWGNRETGFRAGDFTRLRAHSSAGCLAADFDGDGRVDIAIANHKTFGDHVGESFVYWNGPDGFSEQRLTRLPTVGPHALAFAQPRNQIDGSEQEYYVSEPYRLPEAAIVQRLDWEVEHARSTWVRAQIRTAATPEQLDDEPWRGGRENDEWLGRRQPLRAGATRGRWMQYRLALGAANGGCTPRVREVRVEYGARQP